MAVLPRVNNSLDNALSGNIGPYVLDYTSIAAIADQIDVIASSRRAQRAGRGALGESGECEGLSMPSD